ncbi:MAG: hypothetical protein Q7U54_21945 [Bacteroidales bacterium]|nr:hypothetical protein [Bacteroidales bacterium]
MYKLIITLFFVLPLALKAQQPLTYRSVDSITYRYYLDGEWNKLIKTGKQALDQNIDFEWLRQRMGYAYFVKADYYASQKHYEKALGFKESDISLEYLYYCGIYTGNTANARYHAANLSSGLKEKLMTTEAEAISSIDLEYNYKTNNYLERSNPTYMRAGISSLLDYHVSLYQSISTYKQIIDSSSVKQVDYLASLNWSLNSHTTLTTAYHYLSTNIEGYKYPGHLLYGSLNTRINRYSYGFNGSFFRYDLGSFFQLGINAGIAVPGKSGLYFNTALNGLIEQKASRLIISQVAGIRVFKSVWAQGLITIGNIQNYTDHGGLYVYNSLDPTVFRTGGSLFWYAGKKITFYGNFLYDTKQIEQTTNTYIQQSFLGGLIWKL